MRTCKRKLDTGKLASAIARALRRDFEGIDIVDVWVAEGVDQYGEDLLRVQVVFEGDLQDGDIWHVVHAPQRLDPILDRIGTDLYPVIDFVAKSDYDRECKRRARR
jgi:hypothetical protein